MDKLSACNHELFNHYMAPLTTRIPGLKCMEKIQHGSFKMDTPLKTQHREVVLGQFHFVPGSTPSRSIRT